MQLHELIQTGYSLSTPLVLAIIVLQPRAHSIHKKPFTEFLNPECLVLGTRTTTGLRHDLDTF